MGHKQGFSRVGESEEKMYGPRTFVVCGYTPEEDSKLSRVLSDKEIFSCLTRKLSNYERAYLNT